VTGFDIKPILTLILMTCLLVAGSLAESQITASAGQPSAGSSGAADEDAQSMVEETAGSLEEGSPNPVQLNYYQNHTFGFSMTYPESWTGKEAGPNDMGLIAGFLAPKESSKNPQNYLMVQYESLPLDMNLDQYVAAALAHLNTTFPDLELISDNRTGVSSQPARELVYAVDRGSYKVLQVMTVRGQKAFIITFNARAAGYALMEDDARDIISSFQFI